MKIALFWKMLERFGVRGIQFILQVVLARLLTPDDYGVLSLMVIFTALANVFIQNGFNTALIQNKEVTEEDYSSVFWVSFAISVVLYALLWLAAPWIGAFYEMPEIVTPFRVLCLMLIPGALNSVQLAKVSREMDFRKVFTSNIGAIAISGVVGIVMAYLGAGLWALVAQTLLNVVIATVVMCFTVDWRPRWVCNCKRVVVLFRFGWKLLVSSLIATLYQDIHSMIIGKKYNTDTLGYYDRGKQFPQFLVGVIDSAIQSVVLPAMSAQQDDKQRVKGMMRYSIMLSAFFMFPMMAGLAGVAQPLVELILTDAWLPCVPYLQIYCFSFAFYPIHSSNLQAINAVGRSDMFLKLEIIKKIQGLVLVIIAVYCFDSPIAIALTGVVSAITSSFINAFPNKKLIGYAYSEQMKDILPSALVSLAMFGVVLLVGQLPLPTVVLLIVQIVVGVATYMGLAALLRLEPLKVLISMVQKKQA